MDGILWVLFWGIAGVAILGACLIGLAVVAALVVGTDEDDDADPADEAGEVRERECTQMAAGLRLWPKPDEGA